ncbi:hypothetical protein [Paraburkholderia sp. BL10I2N1]|nr:hypothetical protein [Paraburkholderia sp. BL10I2N1]
MQSDMVAALAGMESTLSTELACAPSRVTAAACREARNSGSANAFP